MILYGIKNYLRSLKKYIYAVVFIFILFLVCGYFYFQQFPKESEEAIKKIGDSLLPEKDISSFSLFWLILKNNVGILFFSLLFSFIAGLSSLAVVIVNGIIIGVFAGFIAKETSWEYFIAGIFPHGVFELSAFFLTSAIGLKIGKTAVLRLIGKRTGFVKEFTLGMKFFVFVIIPMLIIAAFIETFITPIALSLFA